MIVFAGGNAYNLAHEHKNGWNADAFRERYSEVLERYDYIVGDWGYSQLRLRGFYQEGHPKATKESAITSLVDYLNEYCNFGCAYFVLAKTDAKSVPPGTPDLGVPSVSPATGDASAVAGEQDAQTAETAAAAAGTGGILMRWPLKERPGGPVRVPGAAAMARAAQEAERRNQQALAAAGKQGESRPSSPNRHGNDGSYGGRSAGRPSSGGGSDKRVPHGASGAADGRSGGKPQQGYRGPRPQSGEQRPHSGGGGAASSSKPGGQWRQQEGGSRPQETPRGAETGRSDGAKSGGSRWPGKNRRRNRFGGGKPGRPEGGGSPGKPGAE